MSEFEVFRIERRDAVAIVWIDRPEKKNAMNPAFFRELPQVLDSLGREDGIRAIILTGAGDAFSAGGDIASFQALSTVRPPAGTSGSCSTRSTRSSAPNCR